MAAGKIGHVDLAKRLVQAGANKYAKDEDGNTAITMVVRGDDVDVDVKRTMVDILVDISDPSALEPLLRHVDGVGPQEAEWLEWLLRIAAVRGKV